MPANLTPQYHRAEMAYREASTPDARLEALQAMLRTIPKHKGTDHLQADLKSKIAKLKQEIENQKASASTRGVAHLLPRQGAGRAVLVGAPNVGKSQLLAQLTRAKPLVADYPYSTQTPVPGMMLFEDCPIQLIDLPPISEEYSAAEIFDYVRTADLVLWVVDLASNRWLEETEGVLQQFAKSKTRLGRESRAIVEQVGMTTTQTLLLCNKIDLDEVLSRSEQLEGHLRLNLDRLNVSGRSGEGLERLPAEVFQRMSIVRVYAKDPRTKELVRDEPYFLKRGQTLVDFARKIHAEMATRIKSARVWSRGETDCAVVKPDYEPSDQDLVELQSGT